MSRICPQKFVHVVYRTRRFAFANLDVLQPSGSEGDRRGLIGVDHVAYTYASLKDLLDNYAQLNAAGITPYWCVHHGMTISMYYADPIGVEYDPEDWLTRIRSGAPLSDFLVRSVHEPISPIRGALAGVSS